ncbi:MAG: lysophospholipid acyltransferase family protein [bacterium]|nr:lysophospholipid acyltransferase family protein [bacterium]
MVIVYAIFQRIVWLVTFICSRFFGSFKIVGQENLKNIPKPLMIISNHKTFFDPLVIGTVFPFFSNYLPITFMVDDRYYKNIFLKPFFLLTQTFPSYYGQGLDVSLRKPRKILKNNGVFLIFPTGERHTYGPRPRPKRGAAVLATEKPDLNIVPMYISVSKGKTTLSIGKHFRLNDITDSQDIETVSQLLAEKIYNLS